MAVAEKAWNRTGVQNLYRHRSGIYYARTKVNGKPVWKTLETDVFSVAKLKKEAEVNKLRKTATAQHRTSLVKGTVGEARTLYLADLKNSTGIKASTVHYREQTVQALFKTWPELQDLPFKKVKDADCKAWAKHFLESYSPTRFNNTVDTLRQILQIGVKEGFLPENPAKEIQKAGVWQKKLILPSKTQFELLVKKIESAGAWCSAACADLVRFLAFSGCRQMEAAFVKNEDLDFEKDCITIWGHADDGTKNGEFRVIPMIPEMRKLLQRLVASPHPVRNAERKGNSYIMAVVECQKAIDRACEKLKMPRITHRDLRHLFATICIESGVDIPTISRWLGHKDGGVLAMKIYGHLRDEHSIAQAKKVTFIG